MEGTAGREWKARRLGCRIKAVYTGAMGQGQKIKVTGQENSGQR